MARHLRQYLLVVDGVINVGLGAFLIAFPAAIVADLGLPGADVGFYPNILGGVLLGIGLALLIEPVRGGGLGLRGAVAINLCGGAVLAGWLLFGSSGASTLGAVLLWILVVLLVALSVVEITAVRAEARAQPAANC